MADITYINKKALMDKEPYEVFKLAFAADPNQFKKKFLAAGIIINNENDLYKLSELVKSGGDKAGVLRYPNGAPLKFDAMEIFSTIELDANQVDSLKVKFA